MGADEPCLDAAIDRYDLPDRAEIASAVKPAAQTAAPKPRDEAEDLTARAEAMAGAAASLTALAEAQEAFDGIELRKGARNFCFADGNPAARVMIVGEAPGEEEGPRGPPLCRPRRPA